MTGSSVTPERWSRAAIAALVAIVVVAAVLRFWNLRDLPAGFYCDEAANGYNAYSLLRTGRDENGARLPLFVWSFETAYKNPIYVYSTMLPVAAFGLDEFSTRAPAALYGTLTVLTLALAGAELFGVTAGIAAAAFLAVQPWHLHFSRIAFELICFPCLFVCGVACLRRGLGGSRWAWHAAAVLFGLCSYSYAPAKVFVPLFLAWIAVVYPEARRTARWAMLTYVLISLPWIAFDAANAERVAVHLRDTSITQISTLPSDLLLIFARNYAAFLSPGFLFQHGDVLPRHAVQGFGELSLTSAPFLAVGVLACARRERDGLLLLGWLLLSPVTAALQLESPSASHGIIGTPAWALLAGVGFQHTLELCAHPRVRSVTRRLGGTLIVATLLLGGSEAVRYWRAYSIDYPTYAATSWTGFQYGYRDLIHYMESQRRQYRELLLTTTESNEPYIFTLFYRAADPAEWQQQHDPHYHIVEPDTVAPSLLPHPALLALRPQDLAWIPQARVTHTIIAPGGQTEFVVVSQDGD